MNNCTFKSISLIVVGMMICLQFQNCGGSSHHPTETRGSSVGCRWGVNGCAGAQLCEPMRAESEELVCNLDNSKFTAAECTKRNQIVTCCAGTCSCCASNHDPNNCENECTVITDPSRLQGNTSSAITAA